MRPLSTCRGRNRNDFNIYIYIYTCLRHRSSMKMGLYSFTGSRYAYLWQFLKTIHQNSFKSSLINTWSNKLSPRSDWMRLRSEPITVQVVYNYVYISRQAGKLLSISGRRISSTTSWLSHPGCYHHQRHFCTKLSADIMHTAKLHENTIVRGGSRISEGA